MQPTNFYRPTFAQIDLNAIKMNILNLKKHIESSHSCDCGSESKCLRTW